MKTSKLVLGTLVLATAAIPAHAQQMLGVGGMQHQAANSQVAMVASTARPMATAALAPRTELSTSLPMTRSVNPALISIERAPRFSTHTVYQYPKHAPVPVKMNVFPSAKYVSPSVRFQLTMGSFAAPNYTTPSVPFPVIAAASYPLPNVVAR